VVEDLVAKHQKQYGKVGFGPQSKSKIKYLTQSSQRTATESTESSWRC
jgi:hypothetical protein